MVPLPRSLDIESHEIDDVSVGRGRREKNVLFMSNVNLEARQNFFTVRVIAQWNALPDSVKEQKSVNAFKSHYNRWKRRETEREERNQNS